MKPSPWITMIPRSIRRQEKSFIDALNIFSKSKRPYKPSIIASAARGPAGEQFKHIVNKVPPQNEFNIGRLVNIVDMAAASKETLEFNNKVLTSSDVEFKNMMKVITDESRLIRICEFLYFNEKLSFNKLTAIILNKHLTNLKGLPFDIDNFTLGWSNIDHVKFDIMLMKKYANLHRPLSIIKKLHDNYESRFLPLIVSKKLPQFYQRIVWKYYFEYSHQREREIIMQLNDINHSVTIWESSIQRSSDIAGDILEVHGHSMNELLQLFFKICANVQVKETIHKDLLNNKYYSPTLNSLKKISATYKLHRTGDLNKTTIEQRAQYYMALESLERFVQKYAPLLLSQVKDVRLKITKFNEGEIGHWDDKLVLLSSFMK